MEVETPGILVTGRTDRQRVQGQQELELEPEQLELPEQTGQERQVHLVGMEWELRQPQEEAIILTLQKTVTSYGR